MVQNGHPRVCLLKVSEVSAAISAHFEVFMVDDNRTREVVLLHRKSKTLILSDLLYKASSRDELQGPGGAEHRFTFPKWFAQGQEELFYKRPDDNSQGLLPAYRTHPSYRKIDLVNALLGKN